MKTLKVDRRNGIVTVTLDRPDRKNALDDTMYDELLAVGREIATSPERDRAVVITGAGDAFCSGADLADSGDGDHSLLTRMRKVGAVCLAIHDLPQPTIALVNGPAVGAGFGLALSCDLVVARTDARFVPGFAGLGLSADFGISWVLPRLVGPQRAKELILLATDLSAGDAAKCGLVNHVAEPGGIEDFVEAWAQRLAAGPPIALSLSKRLLNQAFDVSLAQALEGEAQAQCVNFATDDFKEAFRARRDRRGPEFHGR